VAENDWASAHEQALMRWRMALEEWADAQERIYGKDWARRWRERLRRQHDDQRRQIRDHARQIERYRGEVERQAGRAGYRVTWR
jgi:hypothetical protein